MTNFKVRRYRDEDEEVVKEIFTLGMSEHIPGCFVHTLKQPLPQMVLVCVFCTLLASSRSLLLPVLVVSLLLAGTRQLLSHLCNNYIDTSLRQDLHCIRDTYMAKRDSCFWVAESEGRVVGMVAGLPSNTQRGCLELKRMSVRRDHRGLGIAKALCKAVADFAHDRGYQAVVLYTSVVQTDAQKLYEHMGYKRTGQVILLDVFCKLTSFYVFEYKLEILEATSG